MWIVFLSVLEMVGDIELLLEFFVFSQVLNDMKVGGFFVLGVVTWFCDCSVVDG